MEYPFQGMTKAEKFAYLKNLEREIKKELKALQSEVKTEFEGTFSKSFQTEFGTIQKVSKVTVKPKETLQVFLHEKGLLEICKYDDIDMNKVRELVEAGIITEEELDEHLNKTESEYFKIKN